MSSLPSDLSGFILTSQQERALSQIRHLSVTANAGSGKTRVLVERYLAIVLGGSASVRDIVALTYTEKAASELRRKIAQAVAEAVASSHDPQHTRRLEGVRNDLPSAMIGTIHAFCARLLREHPVEADVDAAFAIIEGLDQRSLLEESVRETFRKVLAHDAESTLREPVFEAIRMLGRSFVVDFVKRLAERRGELERLIGEGGLYHRNDDLVLRFWGDHLREYAGMLLSMPSLLKDLERIMEVASGRGAKEVKNHYLRFRDARDTTSRATAYSRMIEGMCTSRGGLLVNFVGKGGAEKAVETESRRLSAFDKILRPILPLASGAVADNRHQSLLTLTRTLLAVTHEAVRRYQERKTEAGQLDFEDLQLKTRILLSLEGVREQLRKRYGFVMVDEYQDTNDLQYDILVPLLDGLQRGNLFIVGDPKQSIYSFRQANVEVFERTRGDIRGRSGDDGDVVLEESFRPLRDLAAFVNLVFSQLMRRGRDDYWRAGLNDQQVRYDPLVRARQNTAPGRVEILVREESADQTSVPEGDLVARRIIQLVGSGQTVYDKFERSRAVTYHDVAVLLRTRKHLPELERSLIHSGVPYVVSSGVGYFQTQDIFDFYNYLEFLLNPADDVALAGLLRSPFFSVSDAELFDVAADRGGRNLWDHLVAVASRSETPTSLRRAVVVLGEDLSVALRYPVPELIARIVQRTRYVGKIAATVRGAQAKANLQKLQQLARTYERHGFATLFDFVRRLKGLIDEEEREGQGTIEAAGDAVQVMTVHAAKGLEFPVVMLPYLSRQLNYDKEPFLHDLLGVAFSVPDSSGKWTPVPLTAFFQRHSQARTEAEEQRIFYVACTRARDMLVLSVDPARTVRTANCRDWLLEALGRGRTLAGKGLEFTCTTKSLTLVDGQFVPSSEEHSLPVHLLRAADLAAMPAGVRMAFTEVPLPRLLLDPVNSEASGEIFSATKIRTYVECPARYFLRYILGFPSEGGPFAPGEDDELRDRDVPAELRGRIFHSLVQRFALESPDRDLLLRAARSAFEREAPIGLTDNGNFAAALASTARHLIDSPFWQEMMRGSATKTEFTMSVSLDADFLTGTLDRIYQDSAGVWTVVDYKTDTVDRAGLERKGEIYWPQLEFYALLVSQFFGVDRVNAILLFVNHVDAPLRREFGPDALLRIRSEITDVIGRIHKREFRPNASPCTSCPFGSRGCAAIFSDST